MKDKEKIELKVEKQPFLKLFKDNKVVGILDYNESEGWFFEGDLKESGKNFLSLL